ncbi:DC1 [Arabidopsis suecica]|uniref:DC1 n=1 Tax=Arabidopsis suecica TaxID=45249 RepID=A0A8T2H8M9_ARASU|nr:DC1 [Arabidopsis suecica]
MDSDSESELMSVISQLIYVISIDNETKWEKKSKFASIFIQLFSLVSSMDLDSQPKPESKFISLIKQVISVGNSNSDSDPDSWVVPMVTEMISLISSVESGPYPNPESEPDFMLLTGVVLSYLKYVRSEQLAESELKSLVTQIIYLVETTYSEPPELKLVSLIKRLMPLNMQRSVFQSHSERLMTLIYEIIHHVCFAGLDSLPKPESKLMSVTIQTISFFNSIDLDSQPKPLKKLISIFSNLHLCIIDDSYPEMDLGADFDFMSLVEEILSLDPEPELISLILQITSLVFFVDTKWENLISLCPSVQVKWKEGKLSVRTKYKRGGKLECIPSNWKRISVTKRDATHFLCRGCKGKNHKEYKQAPVEIKHPLHPKHSLHLVFLEESSRTRNCYCCYKHLEEIFYYCSACDFAIRFACVQNTPDLYVDHPKWHRHTLALFPTQTPFTCSVCALTHSECPLYVCPPCDFAVHQRCFHLPRVIRISRHPHRIFFITSFDQGDWYCGVCRRRIHNDYGGYSCIKDGCLYAVHSRCGTQSNVWDGKELEGEPEEVEEEVEPYVRIRDGVIQHFCHQHHQLRLDENADRNYNENKFCQVCITPIYFGNIYSCMQCDYILHQICANLPRKMHQPIHPHLLTLVNYDGVVKDIDNACSACPWICTTGFFYECSEERCKFKLNVQCTAISEPLLSINHIHPLFLTSKPGEYRKCNLCGGKSARHTSTNETFNCIEECHFSLCFGCATLPQTVRYKHDKHMLTLSYGDEKSIMTYWCEACEGKIDPKVGFYMCDEYCCITLHITCMLGEDLYIKPGSSFIYHRTEVHALSNNHHMSRPICSSCEKRCSQKIVFKNFGFIVCSLSCIPWGELPRTF